MIKCRSGKYTLIIAQQTFYFETHHVLKNAWFLVPPYLKYELIAMQCIMNMTQSKKTIVLIGSEHQCKG